MDVAQRKRYSAEFKAQVTLEALKGQKTVNELASTYGCIRPRSPIGNIGSTRRGAYSDDSCHPSRCKAATSSEGSLPPKSDESGPPSERSDAWVERVRLRARRVSRRRAVCASPLRGILDALWSSRSRDRKSVV